MAKKTKEEQAIFDQLKAEFEGQQESNPEQELFNQLKAEFEPQSAQPGLLDTISRKATQGATFDFGDELAGLINKGISGAANLVGAPNPYETDRQLIEQGFTGDLQADPYQDAVAVERERLASMGEARPVTSFVSSLAGMGATAPLMNPVAGAYLQGVGAGESAEGRLASGVAGAASVPILGAAGRAVGPSLSKVASSIKNAPAAQQFGSEFSAKVAPGIKNLYKAITNNGAEDIGVMEALTRQKDLFKKTPLRTNAKYALDVVDKKMTDVNKRLSDITKSISAETNENMLTEFQSVSNSLRQQAEQSGNRRLLEMADKFDESIVSGDYNSVFNAYKNLIKNNRVYDKAGTIIRYKGDPTGAIELADDIFMNTNTTFLDDIFRVTDLDGTGVANMYGDEFKNSMAQLKDLHILDNHLTNSAKASRGSFVDDIRLMDTAVAGGLGALVGGPVGAIGGAAIPAAMRTIPAQNLAFRIKDAISSGAFASGNAAKGVLNRTVPGVVDLVQNFGDDLVMNGVNPQLLSSFSRAVSSGITPEAESLANTIMNQVPEYFDNTGYMSEVNGKLTDPMDIELERARITDATQGNIIERAKALSGLNKNGSVYRPQSQIQVQPVNRNNGTTNRNYIDNAQEIDRLFKNQVSE